MTLAARGTRLLFQTALRLVALAMLGLAVLVVTGHLRLQPVLTGSMAPRFPTGTLVAVTPVVASSLRVGDVVMFVPPRPYGTPSGGPVMHRIVAVDQAPGGRLTLRTKGDANAVQDPWVLDGNAGGFARLRASSVVLGRALRMARGTTHGPALLFWPGLILLWLTARHSRNEADPRRRYKDLLDEPRRAVDYRPLTA